MAWISYWITRAAGAKRGKPQDFLIDWDREPSTDDDVFRALSKMMEEAESQPSPPSS